jgi:Trypsin-co-occurring domain 1
LTFGRQGVSVPVAGCFLGEIVKRLVEFPVEQGGSVLIEIEEPLAGPVTRGLGKDRPALVEQADKTFEDATATITPAARSLIARLRSIDDPPDEVGIEFGVQLSAQTGSFIASVAGQANFRVLMTWRRGGAMSS